ncbi:hypothetical protein IQ07DRAFT_677006 [Pyrenochaeta sp. DS3sAY3a]|nr:hypothetical protein IQ07DRAFT_677006 [Pyrenochaeta sp. DS3sAY3a]
MSWIAATDVRQSLRSIDSLTVANEYNVPGIDTTISTEDPGQETYLPSNHGVTGREPNTNPQNWMTDHRRMPPHRPPVIHPQWVAIGGPLPMRIFLWDMFKGCQLLQWGYTMARVTGLHNRGYCMYKVANEW